MLAFEPLPCPLGIVPQEKQPTRRAITHHEFRWLKRFPPAENPKESADFTSPKEWREFQLVKRRHDEDEGCSRNPETIGARNAIAFKNRKLCYAVAQKFWNRNVEKGRKSAQRDTVESLEDLVQIGLCGSSRDRDWYKPEGLMQAVLLFNPDKGAFPPFAKKYIDGAIRHDFRDRGRAFKIPRREQELSSAVKTLQQERRLKRLPPLNDEQISGWLGISLDEWADIRDLDKLASRTSLDAGGDDEDGNSFDVAAPVDDDGELRQLVRSQLARLETTDRDIVSALVLRDVPVARFATEEGWQVDQLEAELSRILRKVQTKVSQN